MRRLLAILLMLATAGGAYAQGSGQPCAVADASGKLTWFAACDLPEDGAYLKCYATAGSGKKCWLSEGPIDTVLDENGDGIEESDAPIYQIWGSETITPTRGDAGVAILNVATDYDPAIIDDTYLNGKGALTSQAGGTLNATITIGSGGKFQDDSTRQMTTGYCFPTTLTGYAHNVGSVQYFRWSGGAATGTGAGPQNAAETPGLHCPGGFRTIGLAGSVSGTQTAIPSGATLNVGVTVDNTDGSAICSFTNADGADGGTCTPANRPVLSSESSGLWLNCTNTCSDSASYTLNLLVCCR